APTPEGPDSPCLGACCELVCHAALADAGLAGEKEEPSPPGKGVLEEGQPMSHLEIATDEGALAAPARALSRRRAVAPAGGIVPRGAARTHDGASPRLV